MLIFWMLIIYIAAVLVMLISHIFLSHFIHHYNKGIEKRRKLWQQRFAQCQARPGMKIPHRYMHQLKQPRMLAASHDAFLDLRRADPVQAAQVLSANLPALLEVGRSIGSSTMKAYLAYMLSGFDIPLNSSDRSYVNLMLSYLTDRSIYTHENALQALYRYGDPEAVARAFRLLSDQGILHSEKLLTDGLLKFTGDRKKLVSLLIGEMDLLNEPCRIGFVNFLRLSSCHDIDDVLTNRLETAEIPPDARCATLRLLGTKHSPESRAAMLSQLNAYADSEDCWQPAAVAATLLEQYPDDEVIRSLTHAVSSRQWYVRMNAAKSLIGMRVSPEVLAAILKGKDRYAADALRFQLAEINERGNA